MMPHRECSSLVRVRDALFLVVGVWRATNRTLTEGFLGLSCVICVSPADSLLTTENAWPNGRVKLTSPEVILFAVFRDIFPLCLTSLAGCLDLMMITKTYCTILCPGPGDG
jgi:hypothetical protein